MQGACVPYLGRVTENKKAPTVETVEAFLPFYPLQIRIR